MVGVFNIEQWSIKTFIIFKKYHRWQLLNSSNLIIEIIHSRRNFKELKHISIWGLNDCIIRIFHSEVSLPLLQNVSISCFRLWLNLGSWAALEVEPGSQNQSHEDEDSWTGWGGRVTEDGGTDAFYPNRGFSAGNLWLQTFHQMYTLLQKFLHGNDGNYFPSINSLNSWKG